MDGVGVKITGKHIRVTQEGIDRELAIVFPVIKGDEEKVIEFLIDHNITYAILDGIFMIEKKNFDYIDNLTKGVDVEGVKWKARRV